MDGSLPPAPPSRAALLFFPRMMPPSPPPPSSAPAAGRSAPDACWSICCLVSNMLRTCAGAGRATSVTILTHSAECPPSIRGGEGEGVAAYESAVARAARVVEHRARVNRLAVRVYHLDGAALVLDCIALEDDPSHWRRRRRRRHLVSRQLGRRAPRRLGAHALRRGILLRRGLRRGPRRGLHRLQVAVGSHHGLGRGRRQVLRLVPSVRVGRGWARRRRRRRRLGRRRAAALEDRRHRGGRVGARRRRRIQLLQKDVGVLRLHPRHHLAHPDVDLLPQGILDAGDDLLQVADLRLLVLRGGGVARWVGAREVQRGGAPASFAAGGKRRRKRVRAGGGRRRPQPEASSATRRTGRGAP